MPLLKTLNMEPLPGYRLIEPLGKGGFGEVWKCEAPGGLLKAIKFVEGGGLGLEHGPADNELESIQRIKALRHPFLLSLERIEVINGELIIVTELADKSLQDVLNERRAEGLPGIPRAELLRYLREAADVLDLLNQRHGLQHLDIKPANLFLVSEHVKVADFGLVHSLTAHSGATTAKVALNAITPRYAAPELFGGNISPSSDQYSLAILYQELLTDTLPFNGKNGRQLALQHTQELPNLASLPPADRNIIGRALSKTPAERFPNCLSLVRTLEAVGPCSSSAKLSAVMRLPGLPPPDTKDDVPNVKTTGMCPAGTKYLPELAFLQQLGRSPTTEVWSAQAKNGQRKLVKFLYGVTGRDKRRDAETLRRFQTLQHPGLPKRTALPGGPGCLILVNDFFELSLRDQFQEWRTRGEKGLPRRQLLDWLWTAADTLDELAQQFQLQHLGLNPRTLLLDDGKILLDDFGLRTLLHQGDGQMDAAQGRYSAPEQLGGRLSPHCDQYSLAVIYQEMLTGLHPLRGGRLSPPNFEGLNERERVAISRALQTKPENRFANCTELLCALEEAVPGLRITRPEGRIEVASSPLPQSAATGNATEVLTWLMAQASEDLPPQEPPSWLTGPNGSLVLQGRFYASLPPQGVEAKFEGFRRQWNAQQKELGDNSLTFYVSVPGRFWQRWFGKPPGLLVDLHWARACPPLQPYPQVIARIRTNEAGVQGGALLKEIGPALLESIQACLQGQSERRMKERLVWPHPVQASFVMSDGQQSETIECQGKDISLNGIGLYLPRVLPGTRLDLSIVTKQHERPVKLAGNFVRVQRCGESWFEAGISFE